MKTKDQIKRFIKRKSWYISFLYNVNKLRPTDGKSYEWWEGESDTIALAFPWTDSAEGYNYWRIRNLEFKIWYFKD